MRLENFLTQFITELKNKHIQYCILRNYEGLPYKNDSNDIDFLISSENLSKVLAILLNFSGIMITSFLKRPYVTSIFLHNVQWGNKKNSIQIDLVVMLSWKGLPYLSVKTVLSKAIPISEKNNNLIKRPSPEHEAIISFFSSYLLGGWIKEKYQSKVRMIFKKEKNSVIFSLSYSLPEALCFSIVEGVLNNNNKFLLDKLYEVKRSILLKNFINQPMLSLKAMLHHFSSEIKIRYSPYYLDTVCFYGPDGSGKSSIISGITEGLTGTIKEIEYKHLKPKIFHTGTSLDVVTDPHARPPRSKFISAIKIIYWLILYWYDLFFHKHKNSVLWIWDRYYHDLLVDPLRYRYGAPMWLAVLIGKMVPKPGLIFILDAPAKVIQSRKQEVSFEETARQRTLYLKLGREMKNSVIVDTSQPLEEVVTAVNKTIIHFLSKRTEKRLGF